MTTTKKITAITAAAALAGASLLATAPEAHAKSDIRSYQVAFTGGIGVRLRQAPTINAQGIGADGALAMPEGGHFPAECEDYGDTVTNVYGETTNLWMRAPGGVWVSTAYLNTGQNSRVGLPLCSDKDTALRQNLSRMPVETAADRHRKGAGFVMVLPERDGTTARVYASKAATKETANALNRANTWQQVGSTLSCAAFGVGVGVATGGTGLVAGAAIGLGSDIGCTVLVGTTTPSGFDQARGAANAAATADKCYEVRMHKDPTTHEWVADVWTVTDHPDYCA